MAVTIKLVETLDEVKGIKVLHDQNLKENLTPEQQSAQGFVTFKYTLEFLTEIQKVYPSVIAVDEGGVVVGYALVVIPEIKHLHPLINDFVDQLADFSYAGRPLNELSFCLVGQLCVAQSHTGQGLVQRMYNAYRDEHSARYDYLITDVDEKNPRSLRAHEKSGFKVIGTVKHQESSWSLVLWDWKKAKRFND